MIVPDAQLRLTVTRRSSWVVVLAVAVTVLLRPASSLAADPSPTASATEGASTSIPSGPIPSASPTEGPQQASILIAAIDDNGTLDPGDDVLVDGARFEVWSDDGDGVLEPGLDVRVDGPKAAPDGLIDTPMLDGGWYWIVETRVPTGFTGSDPILVELNLDRAVTCIWDRDAPADCRPNATDVDGLSWTVVLVYNTPEAPRASGAGGAAAGGPRITLPPTDALTHATGLAPAGHGWWHALLSFAGLIGATLRLTPAPRARRQSPSSNHIPGSTRSTGPS